MSNFEPRLAEEYLLVKKIREQIGQVNTKVSEKTAQEYRQILQNSLKKALIFHKQTVKTLFINSVRQVFSCLQNPQNL